MATFKQSMTSLFEDFYAGKVAEQSKTNCIKNVRVDMHVSKIKPLHAQWVTKTSGDLAQNLAETIKHSWVMTGIV
jgi:hypothetical protein